MAKKRVFRRKSTPLFMVLALLVILSIAAGPYLPTAEAPLSTTASTPDAPLATATVNSGEAEGEFYLDFIDVGQGDAILLRQQDMTMLIDAGTKGSAATVLDYLQAHNISRLDYVVATHPHADHIGGLSAVIEQYDCGLILLPPISHTSNLFEQLLDTIEARDYQITIAAAGDTYMLGEARCTVLSPAEGADYADLNNWSVVLRIEYGSAAFLFMGDAENLVEEELLAGAAELQADLLKLGHHGSNTSSGAAFLDAVAPQYALALCGLDNSYGHPHQEVLERLSARDIALYRSDYDGHISFICTADGQIIIP